jgi:hypothetical protein
VKDHLPFDEVTADIPDAARPALRLPPIEPDLYDVKLSKDLICKAK